MRVGGLDVFEKTGLSEEYGFDLWERVAVVHDDVKRQRLCYLLHCVAIDSEAKSATKCDVKGLFPIILIGL